MSIEDIVKIYKVPSKSNPKPEPEKSSDEASSPRILRRSNPFKKTNESVETSPSLLQRPRRRVLPVKSRIPATVIDKDAVEESSFFAQKPAENKKKDEEFTESMEIAESMVTHVSQEESKENLVYKRVIIPETEDFEDEVCTFFLLTLLKISGKILFEILFFRLRTVDSKIPALKITRRTTMGRYLFRQLTKIRRKMKILL